MAAKTDDYLNRLQQLYQDVVMNVVHLYFEREVLDKSSFHMFLFEHKHALFHRYIPNVKCCECIGFNSIASSSKDRCVLDKYQFDLLFERSERSVKTHESLEGQKVVKHCVCNINPKGTEVEALDIIVIQTIIKTCCKRTLPGHPSCLTNIKEVRNYIGHIGNSACIKKSDFDYNWDILEQNTLEIELIIGKPFRNLVQLQIQSLETVHDTNDTTQAAIQKANDSLREDILRELRNKNGISQDEFGQIIYKLDELLFKITDLVLSVKQPDVLYSRQIDVPSKCYIRWTLSTPAGWCVEDIKRKLECVTQLSNFAIEFIYAGSIIIGTSVSLDLITDSKRFSTVFTEFLQNFVKVCEIDTTTADIVDVEIFASLSPIEGKCITSDKTEDEFIYGACRTCDNRNISKNGNNWCTECQELYCINCTLYHQATTCSASHTIISINNEMKYFPPKISQNVTCDEHDFDLNYYCKHHQKIVCIECVKSSHMNCDGIVTLECAAFNIKSSSMVENAETNVKQSIADINKVLADLANQSAAIELEKNQIESAIAYKFKSSKTANEKINSTLNDLKTKYEKAKNEIQNNVENMKISKLNVSDIYEKLYQVTKYCSDIQVFSYFHYITPIIIKTKNTFKAELNFIKNVHLHYKTDDRYSIRGHREENVEIVVQSEPYHFCSVKIDESSKTQTHIPMRSIDKIKLSMNRSFWLNSKVSTSATLVCLNEKITMSDGTKTELSVYYIGGTFDKEIELPTKYTKSVKVADRHQANTVKDITVIDTHCVAVLRKNNILRVNIESEAIKSIIEIIPERHPDYLKISCSRESLYLLTFDFRVSVMDLAGNFVKIIQLEKKLTYSLGISSYAVYDDNIWVLSDSSSCSYLNCFDMRGQKLWQTQIEKQKCKMQITIDNLGNCYVPNGKTKTVSVISHNGQHSKLLSSESYTPRALYFDQTNSRLIVLHTEGFCTIFKARFHD